MDKRVESLLLGADKAATLIGVSRAHFYSMHSNGRLGPMPVRLGRRTLWRREELSRWVNAGCPARVKWMQLREAEN